MRRALGLFMVSLAALGCGVDDPRAGTFKVRGSVEQIHIWSAPPQAKIEVRDAAGSVVAEGVTDDLGSLVFRHVPPGEGYAVAATEVDVVPSQAPVRVMSAEDSLPPAEFYASQSLSAGYQYITTRDGTKLAAYVTLPGPIEKGPYPTIVDYSGYSPAKPGAPIGDYKALCGDLPTLCDAPNDPSAFIASLVGYATVSVNMRGTGCSGGAYDYFEQLQILDGYDIVETVAAQSWVRGHRIAMTGISYPAIAQLFVARSHPPSLAAITPLSVIGNTYTTARPGGIFNDGFALEWITGVLNQADPYGQGWEQGLVDQGDTICAENQLLHSQKRDVIEQARNTPYYSDELVAPLDPSSFVDEIDVPVFLAGGWQDEQTGPFFFQLLDKFTSAPLVRFTTYNGIHSDSAAPQVLAEMKAFLDTYVAGEMLGIRQDIRTLAPLLFDQLLHAPLQIPPDRFTKYGSFEEAKAAYEAEDSLRVIFENGGTSNVGAPEGAYDERFAAWPPAVEAKRFYFHEDGSLAATAPVESASASSFAFNFEEGHQTILPPGQDVGALFPSYDWKQPAAGHAVVFESAPLSGDLVMLGTGSVDLWIRSPVDDADLEVNLSEVRPDGQEMFIQSGWLRASVRKLDKSSTELWPEPTYREGDAEPLVPGAWTQARVGIPAFSHVFRKGSKIHLSVDTPGDSRARWQFALKEFPTPVSYDIGHSWDHASSVVLPVIAGEVAKTPLPPCPSLRGQQCRPYVQFTNTPAGP